MFFAKSGVGSFALQRLGPILCHGPAGPLTQRCGLVGVFETKKSLQLTHGEEIWDCVANLKPGKETKGPCVQGSLVPGYCGENWRWQNIRKLIQPSRLFPFLPWEISFVLRELPSNSRKYWYATAGVFASGEEIYGGNRELWHDTIIKFKPCQIGKSTGREGNGPPLKEYLETPFTGTNILSKWKELWPEEFK